MINFGASETRKTEKMPLKNSTALLVAMAIGATVPFAVPAVQAQDALPFATPGEVGVSADRLSRLSNGIDGMIADGTIAGAVTLVARYGKIAYLEADGFRDIAAGDEMEATDMFRLASMTKPIAAVAALTLVEQGKMLLSDPVSLYLPEFADTTVAQVNEDGSIEIVPADRAITIADLLKHTSGYGYGFGGDSAAYQEGGIFGWYLSGQDRTIREAVRDLAALPAEAQPGSGWTYGYSTDILGAVIEVVSGQPLDAYLEAAVFAPLGMSDTAFFLPEASENRLATLYTRSAPGELSVAPDTATMDAQGAFVGGPQKLFSAGAGLVSTAGDYMRFAQMLLDGGRAADGTHVLAPSSVALMTAPAVDRIGLWGGTGFGFSVAVTTDIAARGVPGSNGEITWPGAYGTTFWVDPAEELVIVYMTQAVPAFSAPDHEQIKTLVYQAITY